MIEVNELLTVPQVARRLGVSEPSVRRWCLTGRVAALLVGGSWRIAPDDLAAMVEEGTRRRLSRHVTPERAVPFL